MTGDDDNRRWSERRSHPFGLWRTIAESSVLSSLAARSSQVVVVNSRGKTNIHSTLPPSRVPLQPILSLSQSAPSVPFRRANERGVSIGQSLPSLPPPSFAAITALTWQSLPPSLCFALLLAGAACVALSMQPERRIGRERERGAAQRKVEMHGSSRHCRQNDVSLDVPILLFSRYSHLTSCRTFCLKTAVMFHVYEIRIHL